ncbi:hypothetical protein [Polaromonas glacialis]|uniref:hypothetical protein n=1 Tax=Polaromonas glacialis TaxID=866564 RepID=UPI00049648AB|nr:hypothetical protein [Polaromonas glacialis]
MTLGLLALQFLLCAALIGVAGTVLCQNAGRIAQATGLTGGRCSPTLRRCMAARPLPPWW